MRRILAILAGMLVATAAITGTALAARADRFTDTQAVVFCEGLTNDAGTVFAIAAVSDQFGSFGDLAFWAAPSSPEADPPTWIAVSSLVMLEGSVLTVTFDLVEFDESADPPFGDPVGQATLTATLTPIGDPTSFRFQDHFGNQTQLVEGTSQELSVSGTLELPEDITYEDLGGCFGLTETFSVLTTNPASGIFHSAQLELNCFWETADGFVGLFAVATNEGDVFADIFVADATGEYFGFNAGSLTTEAFAATWDLFPAGGGEDPVGTAEASATLTPGDRINDLFSFDNFKVHVTGQAYVVDGALMLETPGGPQELTMDAESCFAGDVRITEHFNPSQGAGGPPLGNDTPDAAEPIAIGETVEVKTGGTEEAPEAPCTIVDPEGEFEVPFGHTAWWSFEGTGGDVTVDTAGSDFDTVVGIYTDDGAGGLTRVACVDDVFEPEFSLQASVTVGTTDGVTYLVQAGGFGGGAGNLVLSITN
jgi:hypothetical protein